MCGLTGYSGRKPADNAVLKLLFIGARDRGTDSFGLFYNDKVRKYWQLNFNDKKGDAYEVLYNCTFPDKATITNPNVLAHCRAKSVGLINEANTHPFEYLNEKEEIVLFAHNGTIKNINEMATKYGVTVPVGSTDSEVFGQLLITSNWEVLREYTGTAAFSMYNTVTREFIFWKGFSRHDTATEASNERPLYFAMRKGQFFYHSQYGSLITALDTKEGIYEFGDNMLTTVLDGKIMSEVLYDRSDVVTPTVTYTNGYTNNYTSTAKYTKPAKTIHRYHMETSPQHEAKGKVYFYNGKHQLNGHALNGEYILDVDGKIVAEADGEKYWFWNGIIMKNFEAYNKILALITNRKLDGKKPSEIEAQLYIYQISELMHPDSIYFRLTDNSGYSMYRKGGYQSNTWHKPIFGYYEYMCQDGNILTRKGDIKTLFPDANFTTHQTYPAPTRMMMLEGANEANEREAIETLVLQELIYG